MTADDSTLTDVDRVKEDLCPHCGLVPFEGDEYPAPYTGWSCIICGAQTGPFEDDEGPTETVTYDSFGAPIVRMGGEGA